MGWLGRRRRARGDAGGFSLIEMMVVIVIIGVLAMIAYPSYGKYVTRSKRSAAESFVLEVASRQERYLVDSRQYAPDLATLGMTVPTTVSPNYSVTIMSATTAPPGFVVQATPVGSQAVNDANCGTLTIDNTGNKTASGPGGLKACWNG